MQLCLLVVRRLASYRFRTPAWLDLRCSARVCYRVSQLVQLNNTTPEDPHLLRVQLGRHIYTCAHDQL